MNAIVGWISQASPPQAASMEKLARLLEHRGGVTTFVQSGSSAFAGVGASALAPARPGFPLIVFDGYLANRRDLAETLGCDGSSVEILQHAYAKWGIDFLSRIAGGFAFAMLDREERRLLLVRDPLGVKPLYYAIVGHDLLFGSEPKAIFADPRFERRLCWSRIEILLQPRLADAGETPLAGLEQVKPGHFVEFAEGVLHERRYWSLESRPHEDDYATTVHRVRQLLVNSVKGAVDNATKCAAMLSGGLDSTSVVALAGVRNLDSYCVRFDNDLADFAPSDLRPELDAPFAAKAARVLNTNHHEVELSTRRLADAVRFTRRARDLPGWGQFDASMYCLFGQIAKSSQLCLSGEAADELFGGYPFFFSAEVFGRDSFPWLGPGLRLADYLDPAAASQVPPELREVGRYQAILARTPRLLGENPEAARVRELFFLGMQGTLTVVLDRKDRMSSAWGLDLRLPFTDHRLVDYVWNIPWEFKSRGGTKGLLKEAMRDVVPNSTLERRKSAYPHLQSDLYHRELIDEVFAIAHGPMEGVRYLFASDKLKELIDALEDAAGTADFPGGADPRYMLVHIVELHRWFIECRISI